MRNVSARENHPTREKATRVSPLLASGDFHARSRFARSTIPEEKWGTTRSLVYVVLYSDCPGDNQSYPSIKLTITLEFTRLSFI